MIIREILTAYERRPILILSLATIIIIVFILQQAQIILRDDFGFISSQALGRPWTFVSSIFLHNDGIHLISNLTALFWFGGWLELATNVKRKNILITFLLSGIASSFAALLMGLNGVGASGAISGLSGILIVVGSEFLPVVLPLLLYEFILASGAIKSVWGGISYQVLIVHAAGFVTGILLSVCWKKRRRRDFCVI